MKEYAFGIDLGGTNIKGALVSAKGEILKEHSIPTRVDLGPEAVAERIGQVIAQLSIGEDTVGGVDEVQFLIEGSAEPDGYR